ncbi:MAG: DUF2059 domain-containing protein [Ahrensia sp.]|nr:DUF2059 domain-containing protein [Ahrensia sp.]
MIFRTSATAFALSVALLISPIAATAQEVSQDHLTAAAAAIDATNATDSFDNILLQAASSIKNQLIGTSPDKVDEINTVVDEEAIALAARRSDLEAEAQRLFANAFSKEELDQITEFFGSELGKKYLGYTPILARELSKAARVWATGINRDLTDNVTKRMLEIESQ